MDHGRLRELEWQRDDLWRRLTVLRWRAEYAAWTALRYDYEAACAELPRAL
jgi:hypothetical protein